MQHHNEKRPLELNYAVRDQSRVRGQPTDASVFRGLKLILVLIVLLPFVAGLAILFLLMIGAGGWLGRVGSWLSVT